MDPDFAVAVERPLDSPRLKEALNMNRFLVLAIVLAAFVIALPAVAADKKVPVFVNVTNAEDDAVGTTFGFTFRETLQASKPDLRCRSQVLRCAICHQDSDTQPEQRRRATADSDRCCGRPHDLQPDRQ
jgi:cytochrome c553